MHDLRPGEAWRNLPPEEQVEYLVRLLAETEAALAELTGGADMIVDPATATTVLLREAQAQLQAEHEELERRVAERTSELAQSVAELSTTAAELRAANTALQAEIAQRLRLQQRLERERATLKAVVDSAPVAIVMVDAQARLTLTNPLANQLYVRVLPFGQEYGSHAALELYHPDGTPYDPADLPLTRSALSGETTMGLHMLIRWPNGQRRDLLVNTAPIRDEMGNITGAVGAFQDVTEQRTKEREREQLLGEVQRQAEVLAAQARELSEARDQLERRVAERTAELTQANQELSRSQEQLHALAHRLLEAQETERRAVARELHDETGQMLTALTIELGQLAGDAACSPTVANRLLEQKQMLANLMQDLHELIVTLRPSGLDRGGLVPAISQYVESLRRRHALQVDMVASGLDGRRLPSGVETTVYRLIQEALTNVVRHAQARHVSVVLDLRDDHILGIVEDDGVGFDLPEARQRGRMGLVGMQERAEMIGGQLTIESAPGAGTTVFIVVPCNYQELER